jgi:hypothetical protein
LARDSFLHDPLSRHKLTVEDLLSQDTGDVLSQRLRVICDDRRAQDWIQTIAAVGMLVKASATDVPDDWIQFGGTSLDGRQGPWHPYGAHDTRSANRTKEAHEPNQVS